MPAKISEEISEGNEVDCALDLVSESQNGEGSNKDGREMYPLEAVGHRYSMDAMIKQVSLVSEKHFSDLDRYWSIFAPT